MQFLHIDVMERNVTYWEPIRVIRVVVSVDLCTKFRKYKIEWLITNYFARR